MQLAQKCSSTKGAGALRQFVSTSPSLRVCSSAAVQRQQQQQLLRAAAPAWRSSRAAVATAAAAVPEVYKEGQDPEIAAFQQHQKTAARPTAAEDARTLMALATNAVLSTVSSHTSSAGFPFGSVVDFAVDGQGRPLLATSTLSPHTADLQADGRCSITVMAPGFKSLQDARFTLTGTAKPLPEAETAAVRETVLAKYPNAFYVDFGDFRWFRVEELKGGRFVGGFGRVASVTAEDYIAAKPDPVASFAPHVAGHMNGEASHIKDMTDMVAHYVGMNVSGASMLGMDRLGIDMQVSRNEQSFKLRLPFIRPAENRGAVKEVLVEMTKTARAAVAGDTPAQ
ncbi:hypothetical protein OEZ85_007924 [Tetradesmus obliquus]|uniref:DUF2470 domain-containing protein n=1 Tax=Tetradesmus obliquus TaxID=3088 RepID=A0ABY8THE1_TETOB|nr:hypothetical protein OEZ85_007924 [Tetradesmus obliquus]